MGLQLTRTVLGSLECICSQPASINVFSPPQLCLLGRQLVRLTETTLGLSWLSSGWELRKLTSENQSFKVASSGYEPGPPKRKLYIFIGRDHKVRGEEWGGLVKWPIRF